jgi:exopolysaccharide biosynthesis polyprenyl glycosylphosphotransferase
MLSTTAARRIWKTALLPVIDFLSIVFGTGLVYLVRYRWYDDNFLGPKEINGADYLAVSVLLALATVFVYALIGLYEINKKHQFWQLLIGLSFGILFVLLAVITYLFFNEYNTAALPGGVPVSRFILATGGFFALYAVLLGRGFIWAVEQILFSFNIGKISVALIGDADGSMAQWLLERREIGRIMNYTSLDAQIVDTLEAEIEAGKLAEIYLFSSQNPLEASLASMAERKKISFIFSPSGLGGYPVFSFRPVHQGPRMLLEMKHSNLDGWWVVVKRLVDVLAASLFLVCFSWLYLIIAISIKLDSKGPVFYGSERIGPNGKIFKLWKFRRFKSEFNTSELNPLAKDALEFEQRLIAEKNMKADSVLYKIKDDPRTTRVGRFIEKYSLDELPQFYNVLIGSLSLVGPRPHQPREVAKYQTHHFKVLNIQPGLTGLAQVNGRSDLTFEQEVMYDTFYVEKWNILLDFWILFKTPLVILFSRHNG